MTIQEYISEIQKQFATGYAREHAYRPALKQLLETMLPHLTALNEPARQSCGAPDYILVRDNIPVAFVEAKDIDDTDLAGKNKNKEQFDRYRSSLDNIVFTDYLDFRFYEKGEFVDSIRIAEVNGNKILALKDNFEKFKHLIEHFGNTAPQTITSSSRLAEIMAGKARLLANVIEAVLMKDDDKDGNLKGQMDAFKDILIHDISPKEFADVYAQTITYGMFAARLHDPTPETFSRSEAATLIPKTNPFLRQLFQYVAGYDLDDRIKWIVDDLAETFRVTDMPKIMSGFGKRTAHNDPMIHFYEYFLSAYDLGLRKSRGVWYTPQAVVNFIVRAVDNILQKEFNLPMGLADHSKITIEQSVEQSRDNRYSDKKKKTKVEYHRVQILDPATGTGTFLAEVISQIYAKFQGQTGMWQGYVDEHLLPRLNGFELLMASYAMAHLKIDWMLTETGYKPVDNKRLRIFLTNSLEEYHKDTGTLFAQFLAREANGANEIKRDTPVMVVLGNPPYSGISQNNGEWISKLIDDYKYIDNIHFNERKHWLNDDYVKFIRLGQSFVDKNDEGVLAYINNHSFLDNPTFRGMRWNLLKSFDKIYILDLHGNSKKKEVCPDGSKDENVFDIQQGVSINIFIKTRQKPKNGFAEVFHYDVWGKRQTKYDFLADSDLYSLNFEKVEPTAPFYFFVPKDETGREEYEKGFCINELIPVNATGVVTMGDSFALAESAEILHNRLRDFIETPYDANTLNVKYSLGKNYADFILKSNLKSISEKSILPIAYRPFDTKYIYFDDRIIWRPRSKVMQH
ncbi:MAG: DNA methyltransferase, partial [Alistipes sp.]|nr:DNA methyltransferase [Alistipes sp.]